MRKLVLFTILLSVFMCSIYAQVGIGTTTPNASSVLDLTSTTKAFMPPRMTSAQRDLIPSPTAGMVIFNTTTTCVEIYRGSSWYNLCSGSTVTPAPTITTFAPTSGAVGATVTISGTNLTGATVMFNGVTATTSSVTATSITCTVPSGATTGTISVTTAGGTATSATSFTITGSTTSNSVATANLIAHWTFDNTEAESISGVVPTTTSGTTAFSTSGRIGGCLTFSGGYLVYPRIPNIDSSTALGAGFTLTMWAKIPVQTNLASLWQINGGIGDIWGLVALTYRKAVNDTMDLDGTMTHVDGTGTHSTAANAFLQGAASGFKTADTAWAFIAMSYDSTAKAIKYYANGVLRGSVPITIIPAGERFELLTSKTTMNEVTFGAMDWSPTPFATGGGTIASWQSPNLIAGTSIDDTRLFNITLTQAQITQLYTIGLTGN